MLQLLRRKIAAIAHLRVQLLDVVGLPWTFLLHRHSAGEEWTLRRVEIVLPKRGPELLDGLRSEVLRETLHPLIRTDHRRRSERELARLCIVKAPIKPIRRQVNPPIRLLRQIAGGDEAAVLVKSVEDRRVTGQLIDGLRRAVRIEPGGAKRVGVFLKEPLVVMQRDRLRSDRKGVEMTFVSACVVKYPLVIIARQSTLFRHRVQRLERAHRRVLRELRVPNPRHIRRHPRGGGQQRLLIDVRHREIRNPDSLFLADRVVERIDDLLHLRCFKTGPLFPIANLHAPRRDRLARFRGQRTTVPIALNNTARTMIRASFIG